MDRRRVGIEIDFLVSERENLLRRAVGGWRIARRKIVLALIGPAKSRTGLA